jgi:short-subunit dehydrogenase
MTRSLITGGSAGIGAAFASALAARGDDLVLVARDAERLEQQAARLRSAYGVQVHAHAADLAVRDDVLGVAALLADVRAAGRPAGQQRRLRAEQQADRRGPVGAGARAGHHVPGGAPARRSRRAGDAGPRARHDHQRLQRRRLRRDGRLLGDQGLCHRVLESLAVELHGTGVHVMALCPGFVRTEFHPRAGIDMSALPDAGWIDVDALVAQALRDAERGRVVSVPTVRYKVLAGLARHAPRPLVRAVSGRIAEARRS